MLLHSWAPSIYANQFALQTMFCQALNSAPFTLHKKIVILAQPSEVVILA